MTPAIDSGIVKTTILIPCMYIVYNAFIIEMYYLNFHILREDEKGVGDARGIGNGIEMKTTSKRDS